MRYIFFLPALLFSCFSHAQSFDPKEYSVELSQANFFRGKSTKLFYIEVTPWVVKGGWYQYFFTTYFTAMWSTTQSLAKPYDEAIQVGKGNSYGPDWILASGNFWGKFYDPQYLESPSYAFHNEWKNEHWRRNYNGVFTAHTFYYQPTHQQILFALSHGENKNEKIGSYAYQNTVRPTFLIDPNDPQTYSGGSPYKDCPDAYFGFLNGNWVPYTAATDWGNTYLYDLGPIAWPAAGYIHSDGTQASFGLRHPSSLLYNGYLFIFVQDNSFNGNNGTKLIRCPTNNVLNPAAYETWSTGGWVPSLPAGFSKEKAADFFPVRGPENTPIFPADKNAIRFAVARIKDSNEFLGVEDYYDDKDSVRVAIRTSTDLIHWSDRQNIYSSDNWEAHQLKYAVFLSKDGTSNTEIDPDEFYIIGVASVNSISKLHFRKSVSTQGLYSTRLTKPYSGDDLIEVMPNPFSRSLSIQMYLPTAAKVQLNLYGSGGEKIAVLMEEVITNRKTSKSFNMDRYPTGVYFLEFSDGQSRFFKKMLKL